MRALAWVVLVVGTLYLAWSWSDQLRAVREVMRKARASIDTRDG